MRKLSPIAHTPVEANSPEISMRLRERLRGKRKSMLMKLSSTYW
jgi:hypothetical protein